MPKNRRIKPATNLRAMLKRLGRTLAFVKLIEQLMKLIDVLMS